LAVTNSAANQAPARAPTTPPNFNETKRTQRLKNVPDGSASKFRRTRHAYFTYECRSNLSHSLQHFLSGCCQGMVDTARRDITGREKPDNELAAAFLKFGFCQSSAYREFPDSQSTSSPLFDQATSIQHSSDQRVPRT